MNKQSSARNGSGKPGGDLSLEMLFEMFPDEQTAREWFEGNMWPDGCKCPRCSYKHTCVVKHPEMPYFCCECKRHFNVNTGTVMEYSKISYWQWAVTTYLLTTRPRDITSVQLGRELGVRQSLTWLLLHKLRESWRIISGQDLMYGPVEVDEIYPGGRENKHANKKGSRRKTAVVGIKDRKTAAIRAIPVSETTATCLLACIDANVDPKAKKFTDENRAYGILKNHYTIRHGDGEYV